MKQADTITSTAAVVPAVESQQDSKWTKQHTLISSKPAVDYNNLTAIEAVTMTAVLVLSVMVGVLGTIA